MESEHPFAFLLKITVISGEDLIARDTGNVSDPYVKMSQDKNVLLKTTSKNRTLNPVWNEGFTVQVKDMNKPLLFQVFDKDRLSLDDFMGHAYLNLEDCRIDEAFDVSLYLEPANDEYLIKQTKKSDKSLGNIKINIKLSLAENNGQDKSKKGQSFMQSLKKQFSKEALKPHSAIVHVVLVQAQSLVKIHGRRQHIPFCKLSLANQRYTSKTTMDNTNPKWREAFNFYWNEEVDSHLHIEIRHEDTKIHINDEFLGSLAIDLRHLAPEVSHNFWRPLLGEKGSHVGDINIIVTITCYTKHDSPSRLTNWKPDSERNALLCDQYRVQNTLTDLEDIGHLTVKVIEASGLAPSDLNGLSDPFAVLELKNARVRTFTMRETLSPEWNQVFHFNIKDINDMLELTLYDEDNNTKEDLIGKLMIPLLRIVNGERRWFKLKDKKMRRQARGKNPQILLETHIHWNPVRAAYRTIQPKEDKYMDKEETKFQLSDLKYNWNRIKLGIFNIVYWINYLTGRDLDSIVMKIESILNWESKVLSTFACFTFVFIVWIFEIWMIPFALLIPFIPRIIGSQRMESEEKEGNDLDKLEETIELEDEKITFAKMKEIGLIAQTKVAFLAGIIESAGNIYNFSAPFLSKIAFWVLLFLTIVLYLLPFRVCLICWGLHKLTLRLFLPRHRLFNQSLLNFIMAVPNEEMLNWCREI